MLCFTSLELHVQNKAPKNALSVIFERWKCSIWISFQELPVSCGLPGVHNGLIFITINVYFPYSSNLHNLSTALSNTFLVICSQLQRLVYLLFTCLISDLHLIIEFTTPMQIYPFCPQTPHPLQINLTLINKRHPFGVKWAMLACHMSH